MKNIFNTTLSGSFLFVSAMMIANILNFLFNAILGRTLTLEQFSLMTLINTLWLLITILLNSMAATTNNRVAYISTKRGENIALGFLGFMTKRSVIISFVLGFVWVGLIPFFLYIFHTRDVFLFLSITPAIILGFFAAVSRGFFQGVLSFTKAAIIILTEAISKLLFALGFIFFGLEQFVYLSIPLSIVFAFLVAGILVFCLPKNTSKHVYIFPQKLLFATFLTSFSSMAFLSVDLLLARHFLSVVDSGAYALLSLVGKMIFFLGTLLNVFILTFASRDTGLNKNSATNFYKIIGVNIVLLLIGFLVLGIFGNHIVPLLFGAKSVAILPHLFHYSLAIILFTISSRFSSRIWTIFFGYFCAILVTT